MFFKRIWMLLIMIVGISILTIITFADSTDNVLVAQATQSNSMVELTVVGTANMSSAMSATLKPTQRISVIEPITAEGPAKKEPIEEEVLIAESTTNEVLSESSEKEQKEWQGEVLNSWNGTVEGPSGKETYYNLDMSGVIRRMRKLGYDYEYHIREDGVKMFGPYVMCAANLELRPRGTILETTLGTAIVCDTGDFAKHNRTQVDIAVDW